MKFKLTILMLCIFSFCKLYSQTLSKNDSLIYYFSHVNGLTTADTNMVMGAINLINSIPIDSATFVRVNKEIERLLPIFQQYGCFYFKEELLNNLNSFSPIQQNDLAIEYGKKLVEEINSSLLPGTENILLKTLSTLGVSFANSIRTLKGISYYQKLINNFNLENDSNAISVCYYELAGFYKISGLNEQSVYCCKKSLAFIKSDELLKSISPEAESENLLIGNVGKIRKLALLGHTLVENNQPKEALVYLKDAVALIKGLQLSENSSRIAYVHLQIARAYSLLRCDSATYYFELTKNGISKVAAENLALAIYWQEKGYYYFLKEYTDSAKFYVQKALAIKDSFNLKVNLPIGYLIPGYYLSLIKIKEGEYSKAILLLNEEIAKLRLQNLRNEVLKELKLLASAYQFAGDFKNCASTFIEYNHLHDELLNESEQSRSISFEIEQSIVAKEKAYKQLESENKLNKRSKFYLAGIIVLIIIVAIASLNRSKLKRAIEMEKMRSRLSRDLHDDIGSTLSSINILSRTAQNNLKQEDEKTKASLEKINERSQRLLDNMSDIIWNINPGNDTIEEVMSRMREYATTILEAKNIDYTFNFPKEQMECKLSMEVKNSMYLIFKEAVNNLSKYSGASKTNLSLTFDEKNIRLKIEDNGKGFTEDEIKHRGGLSNMQHRAEEIKGAISIHSVIEKGTIIELTIPRYS